MNHFANVCRKRLNRKKENKVQSVEMSENSVDSTVIDSLQILNICTIENNEQKKKPRRWYVNVSICERKLKFKVDTGAECNMLMEEAYHRLPVKPTLQPTKVLLCAYLSKRLIRLLGKITVPYDEKLSFDYYIVRSEDRVDNLLCLETAEDIGLSKRMETVDLVENNQDLFQGLGKLPGTCKIVLDPTVKPVVARRRRFAHSILPRLKTMLSEMEKIGVIRKVTKPTNWVS